MSNPKLFLRRQSILYHFLQKIYWGFRSIIEKYILGTKVNEIIWKIRHLYKGDAWLKENWESRNHPRTGVLRKLLVEKISFYNPKSILEVGCGTGPNLYLLAKKFPEAQIYGVDINKKSIQYGKKRFEKGGIKNVTLSTAKADNLKQFQQKSVDIVFTASVIFYIGPDKIKRVMKEMIRVTRTALIFVEPHNEHNPKDPFGLGTYWGGQWLRNYRDLLKNFGIDNSKVRFTKIPQEIWGNDYYGKIAHIIEINLFSKD